MHIAKIRNLAIMHYIFISWFFLMEFTHILEHICIWPLKRTQTRMRNKAFSSRMFWFYFSQWDLLLMLLTLTSLLSALNSMWCFMNFTMRSRTSEMCKLIKSCVWIHSFILRSINTKIVVMYLYLHFSCFFLFLSCFFFTFRHRAKRKQKQHNCRSFHFDFAVVVVVFVVYGFVFLLNFRFNITITLCFYMCTSSQYNMKPINDRLLTWFASNTSLISTPSNLYHVCRLLKKWK